MDLRSFLAECQAERSDDIVRLRSPIQTKFELSALQAKLAKADRYPILIAERPITSSGQESAVPVITNVFASRERCARWLGTDFAGAGLAYLNRRDRRIAPITVGAAAAPVKQVVRTGAEVDLTQLPIVWHHSLDPAPYLTAGFFTTFDPDTGIDNCGLHRGMQKGPALLGSLSPQPKHNANNVDKYWARGEAAPCLFWLGHHPLACMGAEARLGYPESHYAAMGGMLGEPLRLVPSQTLGDDILVPADAEIVIEGKIPPGALEVEGPFGEYSRYIGPQTLAYEMQVTAITHRQNPYWHDILVGHTDNHVIGCLPVEARIYEILRFIGVNVKAVHVPLSATGRYHAYIAMKKRTPGEGKIAISTVLGVRESLKHVWVFDDDIDVYDEKEVWWAFATRFSMEEDLVQIPAVPGSQLDPTIMPGNVQMKGGFDCTMPLGPRGKPPLFEFTNRQPPEVYNRVALDDFVPEWRNIKVER